MFVCKSKRLANYLIEHGNAVFRIDCDRTANGFLVFLFQKNHLLDKNLKNWESDKNDYLIS